MVPYMCVALVAILLAPAQASTVTWSVCHRHINIPKPNRNDEVTSLQLSHCYLKNVKRKAFRIYTNLKILDLSSNHIEVIYKDWFGPRLKYLDLSNNFIQGKDIESNTFEIASNLQTIRLDGNNMTEASSDLLKGSQISNLSMSNCNLREIPTMAFEVRESLRVMKLANNQISRLDDPNTSSSFISLLVLDLRNNTIDSLPQDVFKLMPEIMEINLARNRIKYLSEGTFHNLRLLSFIDLSHNFIEHVPANAFYGTYAPSLNISNNRISYLPAHFFTDLKSSGVYLEILFKNNPWQCACLNEALVEAKRLSVVYDCTPNASESEDLSCIGDKPVCVTNDFKCCRLNDIFQFYDSNIKDFQVVNRQ